MSQRSPVWTTRRLLDWTTSHFEQRGLDRPRLCAEMLLAHVLELPRIKLYMDLDRPASELERAAYRELVERASRHEPVEYLVGRCPFYSMLLAVNPAVLIPRPSTETLVDHVIQHARRTPGFADPIIADVGTGSGAIAIALAKNLPTARVIATDRSTAALEVAQRNAKEQGVSERIDFRAGDLLEPLAGLRLHFLASNPPYISDAEWADVPPNVKDHEPTDALRGGRDGLDLLRRLIADGPTLLRPAGQLVLEFASSQKAALVAMVDAQEQLGPPAVLADHEGLPRVLVADRV